MRLLVALQVAGGVERLFAVLHLAHERALARVHFADVNRFLRRVLERAPAV